MAVVWWAATERRKNVGESLREGGLLSNALFMRVNTEKKSPLECVSSKEKRPHKAFEQRKQTFRIRSDERVHGRSSRLGTKDRLSKTTRRRRECFPEARRVIGIDVPKRVRGVPFHRRNFPQGTVGSRRKGHECFLRRVRFLPDSLKTGISSGRKNSPSAVREPSLFPSVRELCRDEVPQERQELLAGNEEGGRGEDEMKTDGLAKNARQRC